MQGRESAGRVFYECSPYLCLQLPPHPRVLSLPLQSYFYKVTENCMERNLPVDSNGSLSAPLFFGQQLSIKPLQSEESEQRSLETEARYRILLLRDTDLIRSGCSTELMGTHGYLPFSLQGGRSSPKFQKIHFPLLFYSNAAQRSCVCVKAPVAHSSVEILRH